MYTQQQLEESIRHLQVEYLELKNKVNYLEKYFNEILIEFRKLNNNRNSA
jgi:hypothetical protein